MALKPFSFQYSVIVLVLITHLIQTPQLSSSQPTTPPTPLGRSYTDRLALVSFKSLLSTGGDGSSTGPLASWNDSTQYCSWPGVACDDSQQPDRVTGLSLESLNLAGAISSSLSNLTFLRRLHLPRNSLNGPIPQELGLLPQLEYINLSSNSLEGSIPETLLCSNLQVISLSSNKLRGGILTTNLSRCSNLQRIFLDRNSLSGQIPSGLGSLPRLQMLVVNDNALSGEIPSSLGNSSSLMNLHLSNNRLEGSIPPEIGNIRGLQTLRLRGNKLSGMVPPSLYNSSSIKELNFAQNLLSGDLPPDLGRNLPGLQHLYMQRNRFEGVIPMSLANATMLKMIVLTMNNLRGSVPPSLGTLTNLSMLQLADNQLEASGAREWSFMDALTNCSYLEELDLSINKFTGPLPDSIGNLSKTLDRLRLRDNKMSGTIPEGIGQLGNLNLLDMESNLFSGTIPESFGKLKNLQGFSVRDNMLSGELPSSMGNLTKLSELYFSENKLSGRIPESFAALQSLNMLDLSHNSLSGTIPTGLLNIPSLTLFLNLSHNSFVGVLPNDVGTLKNLNALDISENSLSGPIPQSLGQCIMLAYLNLGGNQFTGTVPKGFSDLKDLEFLDMSKNQLSGPIPSLLGHLPTLKFLNLSFNEFDGEIPTEGVFSNLSSFSVLGNEKLCYSGNADLNLKACSHKRRHGLSVTTGIIIIVICSVLCCLLLSLCLFCKYSRRRPNARHNMPRRMDSWAHRFLKISYNELNKATEGFSSENLIGAGSFGTVYKGSLAETEIAVKVFHTHQHGILKSFITECEVLRNIRHRNLVRILTSCSTVDFYNNDFKALVYEFMPHGSLETWIHGDDTGSSFTFKPRCLNVYERLNIAIDVASALHYLHNHTHTPIVHCDLKPANVLLDDDMTARVSDFGIAKIVSKDIYSSTIRVKGSIGYIAPECGMGTSVSAKWDVYSYGVLLLEMFSGKRPTDEIFNDGLSLCKYVENSFPKKIMDVLDSRMLRQENDETEKERINEGLISIVRIALICSNEAHAKRMDMKHVINLLEDIKNTYFQGWEATK